MGLGPVTPHLVLIYLLLHACAFIGRPPSGGGAGPRNHSPHLTAKYRRGPVDWTLTMDGWIFGRMARLLAHGSWLMAHGSRLIALGNCQADFPLESAFPADREVLDRTKNGDAGKL